MNEKMKQLETAVDRVLIGKEKQVKYSIVTLLAGGHLLLEDVPGVGKTTLAKALAQGCGCAFSRIQFTPDTMPSDITGVNIYHMETGRFEYIPGPIMSQIVLADEINRTSPKTQASLLEAMEEGQISVDNETYSLANPFMVIATQNPEEYLGTYHLPEAQLDRFMMKLSLGYPAPEQEKRMMDQFLHNHAWKDMDPVIDGGQIEGMKAEVRQVLIHDDILGFVQEILDKTRKSPLISLGSSPRAGLSLLRASQSLAYMNGKDFVTPDDVIELLLPVLAHRITLSSEALLKKLTKEKVLSSLRLEVKVPIL